MVYNFYQQFKDNPHINKLVGHDYMIMEYKCPVESEDFRILSEWNFITYVISGKKDWITPSKTYKVKQGDALFLRQGVHTTRQYFEEDHCVLVFFISDDFIRRFLVENNVKSNVKEWEDVNDQVFEIHVDDLLNTLFYSVYNYLKMSSAEIPQNLVELKFKELLFNIVLNPANKRLTQFFTCLGQSNQTNLEHIMLNNFQYDLQLEDFAKLCGRSLSAFKRDFQNHYHNSPGKWLIEKRLEFARALLLSSDLNINEVGFESGFRNSSHFNKAFKERYHKPPKQFKEEHLLV